MTILSLDEFRATRRQPTPVEFVYTQASLIPDCTDFAKVERTDCRVYAEGYMIHEAFGQFWVHAWWYPPLPYATLEEAEAKLYPWYLEFAE